MTQALQELEQEIVRYFVEKPEFAKLYLSSIDPEDFAVEAAREIFDAIAERASKGEKYDRTLILQEVSENRDAVTMLRYQTSLDDDQIKPYVQKLKDISAKRRIQGYLKDSTERIKKRVSARDFAGKSIDFFKFILDGTATGDEVAMSLKDYVPEHAKEVEEVRKGKPLGLTTGMDILDDYMAGGLKKGDLILIGARPSIGKTSLALTFAFNAAKAGASVLFISVEMKMKDIFDRLLAFTSGIPLTDIVRGEADLAPHYEDLSKLKFRVVEAPKCTSRDVISIATREKYVNGVDLLVVDYLQYLADVAKGQSDAVRVGRISRNLKSLAGTLDIPLIAPAQLNRKSEHRTGESHGIPSLEDLRDSGNLEQDADVVMLLNRRQESNTEASLHIAKNRKGETGGLKLKFDTKTTKFELMYDDTDFLKNE